MGLNIAVETADGLEHPIWDAVRRGPDHDLVQIIESLPSIDREDFEGDRILRPSDFEAWKHAAPDEAEARLRYLSLVNILETEPDYWLHLSY